MKKTEIIEGVNEGAIDVCEEVSNSNLGGTILKAGLVVGVAVLVGVGIKKGINYLKNRKNQIEFVEFESNENE